MLVVGCWSMLSKNSFTKYSPILSHSSWHKRRFLGKFYFIYMIKLYLSWTPQVLPARRVVPAFHITLGELQLEKELCEVWLEVLLLSLTGSVCLATLLDSGSHVVRVIYPFCYGWSFGNRYQYPFSIQYLLPRRANSTQTGAEPHFLWGATGNCHGWAPNASQGCQKVLFLDTDCLEVGSWAFPLKEVPERLSGLIWVRDERLT